MTTLMKRIMAGVDELSRQSPRGKPVVQYAGIAGVGILLFLIMGPLKLGGAYVTYLVNLALIYSMTTVAVSILAGFSGIWSIGHVAFLATGAYMTAALSKQGYSVEVILAASVAAAAAVGFVVGLSVGRFSVLYAKILTLALAIVTSEVIGEWRSVTGGDQGTAVGAARLLFLSRPLNTNEAVLLTVVLAAMVFLLATALTTGGVGRRWLAIKSQRMAAMSIGMQPHLENAFAFAITAAFAAVAGVALAFSLGYISSEAFLLHVGINMVLCVVVGGVGSTGGALVGGLFLALAPELARSLYGVSNIVFGTLTAATLLFLPAGIVPGTARWIRRVRERLRGVAPVARAAAPVPMEREDAERLAVIVRELMAPATSALTVSGLSVAFGGVRALDNVSLEVPPGRVVGLIGPNGAGKTTLLNVLSGYVKPTGVAALRLGDTDLNRLAPYERVRHGFARTFQHAELFGELTIAETVAEAAAQGRRARQRGGARGKTPREVAARLLDALRLRPYAHMFPGAVPFGVQKVADIARALATGAQIIVMDEPFSGLDADERAEVRAILQALKKAGVSILIIDHVVQEVLNIADHMVVLDFGRVLASGSPQQIKNDPKVLAAYLGSSVQQQEVQAIGS